MKVLQVIPTLGLGGAERLVIELSKYLVLRKHTVSIVIFRNEIGYENLAKRLDIKVIPASASYSLWEHSIRCRDFNEYVDEFKPDIIHSHLFEAELVVNNRKVENCRYITHWHGCHPVADPFEFNQLLSRDFWWYRIQQSALNRKYKGHDTQIICISDFIRKYISEAFDLPEKSYHTIYNGIIPNQVSIEKIQDTEKVKLVSLGRLAPFKNQQLIIEALAGILNEFSCQLQLTFVGDGPSMASLRELANKLGLSEHVEFVGNVENPYPYLVQADIMVHSTEREAFGMALIEGMECGLPVVAFDSGGIPEIVEHGITGLLAKPGDIEGLKDNLRLLVRDYQTRKRLSENAKQSASRFTMMRFTEAVEELYLKLTN